MGSGLHRAGKENGPNGDQQPVDPLMDAHLLNLDVTGLADVGVSVNVCVNVDGDVASH